MNKLILNILYRFLFLDEKEIFIEFEDENYAKYFTEQIKNKLQEILNLTEIKNCSSSFENGKIYINSKNKLNINNLKIENKEKQ